MKLPTILTIWLKELKDTTRDKRTLYSMALLPVVLMPLLLVGITKFSQMQQQKAADKTAVIAVLPSQQQNPLINVIAKQPKIKITTDFSDLKAAVQQEKVDAAVQLPADANQRLQQLKPLPVTVFTKSVKDITAQAQLRVTAAVSAFNSQLIASRLASAGQSPTLLSAATVQPQDVSTSQEKSGFGLSFILPLFIVMWSITGGMYTAIDASAGEKERKTLEALLLTPASRLEIVVGKFLAVTTVSLVAILLSLVSMYFSFKHLMTNLSTASGNIGSAFGQMNISASLTPTTVGLMILVSLLLALLFSAILLTVGIFAKSYREAQSYISPLYIVAILPAAAINASPGVTIPDWLYLIPPINAVQLFKELLQGQYLPTHITYTIVSLTLIAIVAIVVATNIFQREKVLFNQ